MYLTRITELLKWVLIVDGTAALLNAFGVVVFLALKGILDFNNFLRFFLSFLMLESLIIALVGCISYLGFEKYKLWTRGYGNRVKVEKTAEKQGDNNELKEKKLKKDIRLVFLVSGVVLFFMTFLCLSLMP